MIGAIGALSGLLIGAPALGCDALATLPDPVQVAWVSPLRRRVGARAGVHVVRAAELRALVQERGRDGVRVLQGLGLVNRKGWVFHRYKVVIFDVRAGQLCRPVEAAEGTTESGLAVCPSGWQGRPDGVRRESWPGCGYLLASDSGQRTLDVYGISWEQASSRGFCVMPLERFLEES